MALSSKPLTSGWELCLDPSDDRWLPVQKVPTEVHVDLLNNSIIPDPHQDLNELAVRWVAERPWTYRCRFKSPAATAGCSTDVVFKGLDTYATVVVNGFEVLRSDNMFVEHRVCATDKLKTDGSLNELCITFESARQRGLSLVEQHPEHRFIVHQTEVSRGPCRKAQYQWGWDWGPILLTCGPWKPVLLETFSARIDDVCVSYSLSECLDSARLAVKVCSQGTLHAHGAHYEILLDGETVAIAQIPALQEAELSLDLHSPRLWWPRGYGRPDMYTLEVRIVALGTERTVLDSVTKNIGLRRVELVQDKDSIGQSFYFRINDVDLFCGGSCWIPADNFLTRMTPEKYREWIVSHVVDGGQNMIRVWGGGIYEDDVFFDACDEAGVLVWQDFCFACSNYPAYPEYLSSVELEARQNVRRLRHHPSLVIWAGNNEDYQIQERYGLQYDFESDKDPQSWLKTDFPARYIYEHLLPLVVREEYHGTGPKASADHQLVAYHPSSPWGNGSSTTLAVDQTVGDVHQWNVWQGTIQPYQKLPEMGGRFVSEFGMEGYPHVDMLIQAITDPDQWRPGSMTMDFRNKAIGHVRRLLAYVGENMDLHAGGLVSASTLEGFAYMTQVMQADAMAWAYKGWRRQWGAGADGARRCGGILVWQLNDCWPTVSWAVVDYHGVRKPAWYAIREAMKPVAVSVCRRFYDCTTRPADQLWQRDTAHVDPRPAWGGGAAGLKETVDGLWIANSTRDRLEGTLQVSFISIGTGRTLGEMFQVPLKVQIGPNGTTEVTMPDGGKSGADQMHVGQLATPPDAPFDPKRPDPFVIHAHLQVHDKGGELLSSVDDVSWPDPLKYLSFDGRGVKVSRGDGCIEITAARPVKGFVIQERPGLRLSSNGFDVLPGRPVRVAVEGCEDLRELKWMYFGQETQAEDWQ